MKLKSSKVIGSRQSLIGGDSIEEYANAGTEVRVLGRAAWAETEMGSNKVEVEVNGRRIVVDSWELGN